MLLCLPFWELTLIISLLFGGYLAFVSGTAVLFVLEMGVSKGMFPFYQAAILGAYVCASLTCSRAIKKWGLANVKKLASVGVIIGGFGLATFAFFEVKNPLLLNSIMMFFAFGCSWLMAPYFSECMDLLPEIKGITASLITSARLLITALVVGLSSQLYDNSINPIAIIIAAATTIIIPLIFHYETQKASDT